MEKKVLEEFWKQGKTSKEIAGMFDVTPGAVNYWLLKYGIRKKSYKHSVVKKAKLEKLISEKKSRNEIAKVFGVSRATVENYAKKWDLKLAKWNEWKGYPSVLSEKQKSFFVGTMLGDGHIQTPEGNRSAQYYAHHGPKQYHYIEWKRSLMVDFMSKAYKKEVKPDASGFHFCTGCNPLFLEWRKLFYSGRKKVFKPEVAEMLDSFGLAVWYMDDGTFNQNSSHFTTQIPEKEAEIFSEILQHKFDLGFRLCRNRTYPEGHYSLILNVENSKKLASIIEPFMHETMLYKIGKLKNVASFCGDAE